MRTGDQIGLTPLTERELLIKRILYLSDAEVKQLLALIETLHDGSEDEIRADTEYWDRQFAETQDHLGQLAAEALAEYRAGKTQPLHRSTVTTR